MKDYILNRLSERSTWVGITIIASMIANSFGLMITPEQQEAIQVVGMMLVSLPGNVLKK